VVSPEPTRSSVEPGPSAADQEAAIHAVTTYTTALRTDDCEAFFTTTTESYRAMLAITDCEALTRISTQVEERVQSQVVTVEAVESVGDSISVSTTDSYTSTFDAQGNPTVVSLAYTTQRRYDLIESSAGWAIDAFGSVGDGDTDEASGAAAVEEPVQRGANPNEQAAIAAVSVYNDAWLTGDCGMYFASTTERFRAALEIPDCATFEASSAGYGAPEDVFSTTLRDASTHATAIAVSTTESYADLYDDADGNPVVVIDEYRWEYYLVDTDGTWRIDDLFPE
jgi:hypothetical protein